MKKCKFKAGNNGSLFLMTYGQGIWNDFYGTNTWWLNVEGADWSFIDSYICMKSSLLVKSLYTCVKSKIIMRSHFQNSRLNILTIAKMKCVWYFSNGIFLYSSLRLRVTLGFKAIISTYYICYILYSPSRTSFWDEARLSLRPSEFTRSWRPCWTTLLQAALSSRWATTSSGWIIRLLKVAIA